MAAPLAVCTKQEQRAVIRFLWLEGVPGAEIHRRLSTQYGDSAVPRRSVYEWIEKFKSGWTKVTHEEGAGRRSTSTIDEKIQQARSTHTHFYAVEHCPHVVLKASDEFQPLAHLPTREIGSLLFVPPWCTLLAERPCLH